jgi:hypothetical protein
MRWNNRELEKLGSEWAKAWPDAIAVWSKYTRLSDPRWCLNAEEEKSERLFGSFAMIRLEDHAVVIGLSQIRKNGLERYSREILAHEIGHHVYCPANLNDHAKMIARMRKALPSIEGRAPFAANLYSDLLINDKLLRSAGLDMAGVYLALGKGSADKMWTLYMRIYEILWSLKRGSLAIGNIEAAMEGDAQLGARLIRVYARDWLDGSGRFAALCLPYMLNDKDNEMRRMIDPWMDTRDAGEDGELSGIAEIDEAEEEGAIHPSEDDELTGFGGETEEECGKRSKSDGAGKRDNRMSRDMKGGRKERKAYRGPMEYGEILKSAGVKLPDGEIAARYYRERALPHLIKFPVREIPKSTEPMPEGTEPWDIGSSLSELDWMETVINSPYVIPGVTTVKRTWGTTGGTLPDQQPIDLYIGIDCSGSMPNPRRQLSYPVLAAVIVTLSALRAGARVMACLSGEPGRSIDTGDFVRDEKEILRVLTDYLGCGYGFGIHRLQPTFDARKETERAAHILIVTDQDIFTMLRNEIDGRNGWEIAKAAQENARGGATCVLNMPENRDDEDLKRLTAEGWRIHRICNWEELVAFAREFSRATYEKR